MPFYCAGWEARTNKKGKMFFVDHNTRSTHWKPPAAALEKKPPAAALEKSSRMAGTPADSDRHTSTEGEGEGERETGRQAESTPDRQTHRHTDTQTDRHTNFQTEHLGGGGGQDTGDKPPPSTNPRTPAPPSASAPLKVDDDEGSDVTATVEHILAAIKGEGGWSGGARGGGCGGLEELVDVALAGLSARRGAAFDARRARPSHSAADACDAPRAGPSLNGRDSCGEVDGLGSVGWSHEHDHVPGCGVSAVSPSWLKVLPRMHELSNSD